MKTDQQLKYLIYVETPSIQQRHYLVEYIKRLVDRAEHLSQTELLKGKQGGEIATSMCGALAHHYNDGTSNEGWINEDSEPILDKLLDILSPLDVDQNNLKAWQNLFEEAKNLK